MAQRLETLDSPALLTAFRIDARGNPFRLGHVAAAGLVP